MKAFVAASALAVASAAAADVTIDFAGATFTGWNFASLYEVGDLEGTLTGVSVNAVLDASTNFTYADDLCIYLTPTNDLTLGGRLQVGGFSDTTAESWYLWANGGSSAPGTTVIDSIDLSAEGIDAANFAFWLGNGYGSGSTSGTWTGSITLHGVSEVVPTPGAMALLGLGGLMARRRRR